MNNKNDIEMNLRRATEVILQSAGKGCGIDKFPLDTFGMPTDLVPYVHQILRHMGVEWITVDGANSRAVMRAMSDLGWYAPDGCSDMQFAIYDCDYIPSVVTPDDVIAFFRPITQTQNIVTL